MAYKQVKAFNQTKAGRVNGYCLQNVRLGFGIGLKHPTAITAWGNTEQHKDRSIPSGVDVPLYYTYKKDGHVNVRMADGRIWNDGTIFVNLTDYLSKRPQVSYLGWGESVNGVRVIEHVPDPAPAPKSAGTPRFVYLKPCVEKWAFYRPGTKLPVERKNRAGELSPMKWGGITYPFVRWVADNTAEVKSPSLGTIWIYVDNDAELRY